MGCRIMEEEGKKIILFADYIITAMITLLTIIGYIKYVAQSEQGITSVSLWVLYLITALGMLATIISVSYNHRVWTIISVVISSMFIFMTSGAIALTLASELNTSLVLWSSGIGTLSYIGIRAYEYLK